MHKRALKWATDVSGVRAVHHLVGPLMKNSNSTASFSQIYFFEPDDAKRAAVRRDAVGLPMSNYTTSLTIRRHPMVHQVSDFILLRTDIMIVYTMFYSSREVKKDGTLLLSFVNRPVSKKQTQQSVLDNIIIIIFS
jgi:hypothetical protein